MKIVTKDYFKKTFNTKYSQKENRATPRFSE